MRFPKVRRRASPDDPLLPVNAKRRGLSTRGASALPHGGEKPTRQSKHFPSGQRLLRRERRFSALGPGRGRIQRGWGRTRSPRPRPVAERVSDRVVNPRRSRRGRRYGASRLRRSLCRLPESLRLPLELHYFVGLTSREVGTALGIPAATVRFRLMVARRRLRPLLCASTSSSATLEVPS
jgi:hypothetical protein